ncbi:MAG: cache domain-containing protein [Desulfotignum sp.]|jgi:PAS domain S-box-containing protein|nr:cache domain-containing protein [Desulfotignum sp.]
MILQTLKFRNKLLVSFLLIFIPLIIAGGTLSYYQVKQILETSIEKELRHTTESLFTLVETTAAISIRNRLAAIAEKNFDLTEWYYSKHRSGLLSRQEAIDILEEIFLNQSIGISGYIYCINSSGDVVIHPDHRVKGQNVSDFAFIQQQLAIKDGYLEYDWKNPGEPKARPKALYMTYYKPLDWIISVSAYRNEFSHLVDINDFKKPVQSFKSGESGYAYILDKNGKALIHPAFAGINLARDLDQSADFFEEMLTQDAGKITYFWKNPGDAAPREKQVIFKHLPRFNWIIGSTSYMEEVYAPLHTFNKLLGITVLLVVGAGIFLIFFVSRSITRPLDLLMKKLKAGTKGDFSVRMDHEASDEIGQLAGHFNSFMNQLESYHTQVVQQIQENKEAQAALMENELKLRGLFDQSFQYTGILAPSGILEKVNQSALKMGGFTPSDVLFKPVWETPWWPPSAARQLKLQFWQAMEGRLVRFETTNLSHDHGIRNVDISIKPVKNEVGNIEFLILEGRDITDLKHAESDRRKLAVQLEKAQKMEAIGTLAGGIAHDFNNILSSIFGYTQLAQMNIASPEKSRNHLDQVLKGAQRAAALVQQILTFSRQTEYQKKPLKIHLIIKESLKLLRSSIPTTIEIQTDIRSRAMILADPTQMHQVMMNLCTNAYHAMMADGGILTVVLEKQCMDSQQIPLESAAIPGEFMKLMVKDTGCGMDERTLAKAFDPYFTTKEIGRGTGFGLALVQAIVEEHQGFVTAESQPGKGSAFSVFIPIVESDPGFHIPEKPVHMTGGNETIMVVDDEQDIRRLTRELLENLGYTVKTCEDGLKALAVFQKAPLDVDLVITDMTMPHMAGDELAARLIRIRKEIPVILCTGYSEQISEKQALDIGIVRYMAKPIQNQDLVRMVREVLDMKNQAP